MLRIENMFLLLLLDHTSYKAAASLHFEQSHTLLHPNYPFPLHRRYNFLTKNLILQY